MCCHKMETPNVVVTTTEVLLSPSVSPWTDFATKVTKCYRCVAEIKVKAKFKDWYRPTENCHPNLQLP